MNESRSLQPQPEVDELTSERCPFCDSPRTALISLFGSQLLMSQHRCEACGSYFEAVRDDR